MTLCFNVFEMYDIIFKNMNSNFIEITFLKIKLWY